MKNVLHIINFYCSKLRNFQDSRLESPKCTYGKEKGFSLVYNLNTIPTPNKLNFHIVLFRRQ